MRFCEVDRGYETARDFSLVNFRVTGLAVVACPRAAPEGAASRSGGRRRDVPEPGSAVASVRDGRGAGFILREMLPRDAFWDDFVVAGGLGGSGRLRGSRPDAAVDDVSEDRAAAPVVVVLARFSMSTVLPRPRPGLTDEARSPVFSRAHIYRNYPRANSRNQKSKGKEGFGELLPGIWPEKFSSKV